MQLLQVQLLEPVGELRALCVDVTITCERAVGQVTCGQRVDQRALDGEEVGVAQGFLGAHVWIVLRHAQATFRPGYTAKP